MQKISGAGVLLAAVLAGFSPAANAAPRLVLSTTAITVTTPISPGSNGNTQTAEAMNAGDGSLNLTATSSASWLSATVGAAGACKALTGTCNPISISLSTAGLSAGTHTEFITLSDPSAVDSPQQIAVTITVAGVPDSVTLYTGPAGSGISQSLYSIYPASAVTGSVSTNSGGNWLQFLPKGGFISDLPDTIQATALNGQAPGTYTGTVTISGSSRAADNKTIAVTFVITNAPVIDLSTVTTVQLQGYPGGPKSATTTKLGIVTPSGNPFSPPPTGGTALVIASAAATSSPSFLTAAVVNANTISISADPTGLSAGIYHGTVTVTSNAANSSAVQIPVEFTVGQAGVSAISAGGIANCATYIAEAFAPGDLVCLFGTQLAAQGTSATNPGTPWSATLGTSQVLVNGAPVPLYYVSPLQINFQIPYSLTAGQIATVQVVNNGVPGNIRSITIAANTPRILLWGLFAGNYGIAVNTDGSLALPASLTVPGFVSHPAKPGDTLTIYGLGFGQTSPAAVEGAAASTTTLQNAPDATVLFDGQFNGQPVTTKAFFAGLSPGSVGLYQVNVTIPAGVPLSTSIPVTVTIGGNASNMFNVAISASGQ
ncbi:MAG TPA: hypothetical protein VG273_07935 [Bryobacteraceae bacterium]|jgi:uncharacterized protein (TIGR03437 family)|nr:hypothetical protein [Bryobacteraceae bacterium]